jgi:hypothetical protein
MIIFKQPKRYIIGYQSHSKSIPDKFLFILKWAFADIQIKKKNNYDDSS